jgi:hypothetical protein
MPDSVLCTCDAVSHPRRLESLITLLWKPDTSQVLHYSNNFLLLRNLKVHHMRTQNMTLSFVCSIQFLIQKSTSLPSVLIWPFPWWFRFLNCKWLYVTVTESNKEYKFSRTYLQQTHFKLNTSVIISANDQFDAQILCFIISLLQSSTCFEHFLFQPVRRTVTCNTDAVLIQFNLLMVNTMVL